MPGLAAIAAKFALLLPQLGHISPPMDNTNYGRLHYDIRAVNTSSGLGGLPPYCGSSDKDVLLVVYVVTNNNDFDLPTPAVPHMIIISPGGVVTQRDRELTEIVASKGNPPILLHNGVLKPHESRVLADVFLTGRYAVRNEIYQLRPEPAGAKAVPLPRTTEIDTPECPRAPAADTG